MNDMQINRINRYLYETGIPNGERQFSDNITVVFDEYLSKQGY